jgi:hypothetical protein
MAKVSTFKQWFNDRVIRVDIKCSSEGLFSIELPQELKDFTGNKEIGNSTLDGIKKDWKELCVRYVKRDESFRKIIIYEFKRNCYICEREAPDKVHPEGEIIKCLLREDDLSFSHPDATGFTIEYKVCYERTCQGAIDYVTLDKSFLDRKLDSDERVMNWTPDREKFFIMLKQAVEQLILKANKFFEQKGDEIERFIDSKTNALPFLSQEEKND